VVVCVLKETSPPPALQTITVQPAGRLDTWAARTLGANLAVNLNGGIMESQGSGAATTATYLGPVTVSSASTINATNGGGGNRHITLAGALSGTGNIAKTGPADLQLTGDNTTFSGNINVNQGRLFVNNTSGSGTGTGVVTVASGARLGGTGTIGTLAASGDGVVVQSGGTFAPGNSPGVITIFGTLTLQPGANFEAEIRTPGTDLAIVHDTVTLSNANLTGSWGGNNTNLFRGTYSTDTLNWIIQNESASPISGFFANSQPAPGFASLFGGVTPQLASLGGQTFAMFYDAQYTAGPFAPANLTGGNDLLLIAVPEPSRAIFALLALGLLCHRRRRA
jgi:MYXO-CTERM domain-containing protein